MRALIQRVRQASVTIDATVHSQIGIGMLILLGIRSSDTDADAEYLAQRCADLRIFGDDQRKMNLSVTDVGGSALVVSQVTLYAETRKGNRPSLSDSASPGEAERLYNLFVKCLRDRLGEERVQTGVFRAMMDVGLINDGPVTMMVESKRNDGVVG
jgi:D-tyrosyl-tRNA(Tyr) deacylase